MRISILVFIIGFIISSQILQNVFAYKLENDQQQVLEMNNQIDTEQQQQCKTRQAIHTSSAFSAVIRAAMTCPDGLTRWLRFSKSMGSEPTRDYITRSMRMY